MRIVVKTPNWLGDAVMSLPTLSTLKEMEPSAHIAVLTRRSLADLYGPSAAHEVLPYDSWTGAFRAVHGAFDAALILPRSFQSAMLMFSARIPRRIGYCGEGRSPLLTDAVPRDPRLLTVHRVHYYHHLLKTLGRPAPPRRPTLHVPDDARSWAALKLPGGPWLAVNPGATYGAAKQWYPGRFVAAARELSQRAAVVVIGGPLEADLGARVAREIPGAADLSGQTTLLQLAAVLQRCTLLLTNDTGPMHVADAVGTRIVALFGPTDPATTSPFGTTHRIVRKPMDCSPCLKRTCPLGHHECMKQITVQEVVAACTERLG